MPPKKKTRRKKSGKKRTAQKRASAEFVILKIVQDMVPGNTVTFVGSAPSMTKALSIANKYSDTSATRLAILERKSVITRRLQMSVEPVEDRIGKA